MAPPATVSGVRSSAVVAAAVLVAGPPAKSSAGDLECHASSPSPMPTGCICIVRETEGVLQCQVLRCQERARRNFVIDQGEQGLSETMVCEAHAAALKAGERYVYNSVANVIYMGQDAPPQSK